MRYPGIEPMMYDYIHSRIKDSGLFKHYIETKDFRGLMVLAAQACVGIKEATGRNDGPLVNSIQRTVDGKVSDNEFWCMDFIMTLRAYAESALANAGSAVLSPIKWTQSCASLWNWANEKRPDLLVKAVPLPGAILIIKHASGGGHTELVIASDGEKVHCIGGNSSGSLKPTEGVTGKIDRNGNGVYYTVRDMKNKEIRGYIKPV